MGEDLVVIEAGVAYDELWPMVAVARDASCHPGAPNVIVGHWDADWLTHPKVSTPRGPAVPFVVSRLLRRGAR